MDYEWWMRVLKENNFTFIDTTLVDYVEGGISANSLIRFHQEELHANWLHLSWITFLYRAVHVKLSIPKAIVRRLLKGRNI